MTSKLTFRTWSIYSTLKSALCESKDLTRTFRPLVHCSSSSFSSSPSPSSSSPPPSSLKSLDDLESILNKPTSRSSLDEKKKALKMEYDYFMYVGFSVPRVITDDMYDKLLETECGESRRRLWESFSRRESVGDLGLVMKRRMAQFRMSRMMEKVKEVEKENFDGNIYNEIGKNKMGAPHNILHRINSNYVKMRYNPRVVHGVQFGQNMVFDLGLPFSMDRPAERRFNTHMKSVYNRNRTLWDPFNIFMCNYDPNNQALKRLVEDNACESYLWNVTQKCFSEIFPREKIVYLSPKSENVLTKFNHDDIYVIGATGDSGASLCHIKVKELGIRSARLNVDPYFMRSSQNNFDVKEIFRIMLDARDTNSNWLYSLRHLSSPKMRVVRWRGRYEHLQSFEDEDTKNQVAIQGMAEEYMESNDQVFINERSISKPRHEDAELFKEVPRAAEVSQSESGTDAMYDTAQDGPLNIDKSWNEWDNFSDSKDPWTMADEETLEDSF